MAALIVWSDVVAIAPDLADPAISAGGQAAILVHVALQVAAGEWGPMTPMGQAYLAAHLGTLWLRNGDRAGPITTESVGSVSVGYGQLAGVTSHALDSTTWGREYHRILRLQSCTFGAVVL